jgi:hypothetical protein
MLLFAAIFSLAFSVSFGVFHNQNTGKKLEDGSLKVIRIREILSRDISFEQTSI